jgi:phagosome assembly factor 1
MEPTFAHVYNTFGPSYPGDYDQENNRYVLQYPGLSFTFSIPPEFHHLYTKVCWLVDQVECVFCRLHSCSVFACTHARLTLTHSPQIPVFVNLFCCCCCCCCVFFSKDTNELPMELPNGSSPLASRVYLYAGGRLRNPTLPALRKGSLYYQPVMARLGQGVFFAPSSVRAPTGVSSSTGTTSAAAVGRWGQGEGRVIFSSSVQDVVAELGTPQRVYHKRHDSMRIHTASASAASQVAGGASAPAGKTADYFFNFFTRGVDVMFDGGTQRVKKIIMHTNFPCHVSFNRYHKCNFRILLPQTAPKTDERTGRPLPAIIGPDTHVCMVRCGV